MTPEQRAIQTQVLYMNMVDYWHAVDLKGGAGVSQMYVEDGIFNGGGKPLVGRAAIEQFYSWRSDAHTRRIRVQDALWLLLVSPSAVVEK